LCLGSFAQKAWRNLAGPGQSRESDDFVRRASEEQYLEYGGEEVPPYGRMDDFVAYLNYLAVEDVLELETCLRVLSDWLKRRSVSDCSVPDMRIAFAKLAGGQVRRAVNQVLQVLVNWLSTAAPPPLAFYRLVAEVYQAYLGQLTPDEDSFAWIETQQLLLCLMEGVLTRLEPALSQRTRDLLPGNASIDVIGVESTMSRRF